MSLRKSWFFALAVVAAGCGSKAPAPTLVGTWTSLVGVAKSQYHFFPDGHFTARTVFGAMFADVEGDYRVEGDRLVMVPTKSSTGGGDPATQARVAPTLRQPSRVPMRWNGPLSFSLRMPGDPTGLTMVRSSDLP